MRSEPFLYRSWAEISTEQIVKNYKILKGYTSGEIYAVVKANAYGHGDVEIAGALESAGVKFFAVSNINEAVRLRKFGIRGEILILGYTPKSHLYLLPKYDIIQAVVSECHAAELAEYAPEDARFHVAIDTGMHRIGVSSENAENTINRLKKLTKTLKITGFFTHFPAADSKKETDIACTKASVNEFEHICCELQKIGVYNMHCLNSAGGLKYRNIEFNTTRLGIALYGYQPSSSVRLPEGVTPALEWKTNIAVVTRVKKGDSIGYGRSYTAKRDMTAATLMTGYADGYPRVLSDKGKVLINGEYAPIVGKVCMDMMMVDVTDVGNVSMGDTAVLIGKSGVRKITADDIASQAGTISYEILTGISYRVERVYL